MHTCLNRHPFPFWLAHFYEFLTLQRTLCTGVVSSYYFIKLFSKNISQHDQNFQLNINNDN